MNAKIEVEMRKINRVVSLFVVLGLLGWGLLGCSDNPTTILTESCENQSRLCGFSELQCEDNIREDLLFIDALDESGQSDCADAILEAHNCGRNVDECLNDSDACDDEINDADIICG